MNIKKLCLGTVQFGLEYGINNKCGKPALDDVFSMMDYAIDRGIDIFDTAFAYGDAEERLGLYLTSRKVVNKLRIVSKLRPNLFESEDVDVESTIREYVQGSMKRLGIDVLEGYLLHTPTDFYKEGVMTTLGTLRKEGLVKNIGVSIYELEHALDVVKSKEVDYIQVPYNIFDQRVSHDHFYELASENKITVFARSPFLQGLLCMNEAAIPTHMVEAKQHMSKLDGIRKVFQLSKLEAAIAFASADSREYDYVVFGVDNLPQLKQDIDLFLNDKDHTYFIEEVKKNFMDVEKSIIFPSLWSKKV